MAHTPGPWYCDGSEIYLEENVCIAVAYRPRMDDEGNRMPNSQVEANARLIAASPELLARLKSMVSGAECECDKGDEEHPLCDICWSRQVIAKAEGRSE